MDYYFATLTVFHGREKHRAQVPMVAKIKLDQYEGELGPLWAQPCDPGDAIKRTWTLHLSLENPLLSDPRWTESEHIEDPAKGTYRVEYQVRDGLDEDGNPTYACRDWILPIFQKAKWEQDLNTHLSSIV